MSDEYVSCTEALKILGVSGNSKRGQDLKLAFETFHWLYQQGKLALKDGCATAEVGKEQVRVRVNLKADGTLPIKETSAFSIHEDDVWAAVGKEKPVDKKTPKTSVTDADIQTSKGGQASADAADAYITVAAAMGKTRGKNYCPIYLKDRLHLLYEQFSKKEHGHTQYNGFLTLQSHDETIRLHAQWHGPRLLLKVHEDDASALDSVAKQMAAEGLKKRDDNFRRQCWTPSNNQGHGL